MANFFLRRAAALSGGRPELLRFSAFGSGDSGRECAEFREKLLPFVSSMESFAGKPSSCSHRPGTTFSPAAGLWGRRRLHGRREVPGSAGRGQCGGRDRPCGRIRPPLRRAGARHAQHAPLGRRAGGGRTAGARADRRGGRCAHRAGHGPCGGWIFRSSCMPRRRCRTARPKGRGSWARRGSRASFWSGTFRSTKSARSAARRGPRWSASCTGRSAWGTAAAASCRGRCPRAAATAAHAASPAGSPTT